MKTWISLMVALMLSGCATSTITAFKDPAFSNVHYDTIVVAVEGMTLAATVEVERQLCKKLAPTICFPATSLAPPTRNYTLSEIEEILHNNNIQASLLVSLKGDKADAWYLGTINNSTTTAYAATNGSATFAGNNALFNAQGYGTASSQTSSMPIYGFSRIAFAILSLRDEKSKSNAWSGEIRIVGNGTANTTDSAFIGSATSKIAKELRDAQLVD